MKHWRTLVIINPISGTNRKLALPELIARELAETPYQYEIRFTEAPGHATALARQAVEDGYEVVIAVGGDGTVNETARALIHSDTALGIVPSGSGNGLGRHLKIPSNPLAALRSLREVGRLQIDVCTANDEPFFNVAGVGYDAKVAHEFAQSTTRGMATYSQIVLGSWFQYQPAHYQLVVDKEPLEREALMITVANGSQFGNNAYIAPKAELNDGEMDIAIMAKFPAMAVPLMALKLFSGELIHSRYTEYHRARELRITQEGELIHLDGEARKLGHEIHFKVLPKALNILVPKAFFR